MAVELAREELDCFDFCCEFWWLKVWKHRHLKQGRSYDTRKTKTWLEKNIVGNFSPLPRTGTRFSWFSFLSFKKFRKSSVGLQCWWIYFASKRIFIKRAPSWLQTRKRPLEAWGEAKGRLRANTDNARGHGRHQHYKLILSYPEKGPTSCKVN